MSIIKEISQNILKKRSIDELISTSKSSELKKTLKQKVTNK